MGVISEDAEASDPEFIANISDKESLKIKDNTIVYFGEDVFTGTFSFNLEEEYDPIEGEVYISLDQVSENAEIFKQDFISECKRVIIHGCLHLMGFNDELPEDKT